MSRAVQVLSEHLEDEEQVSKLAEALVKKGFRDKKVIDRVTRHSYSEGRKEAESEFAPKLQELTEIVQGFQNKGLEEEGDKPDPQEPPKAPENQAHDREFMALVKRYETLEKENKSLRDEFKGLTETFQSERRDLKKREQESIARALISDAGFEEVDDVLAILRSKVSIGPGVNDDTGTEELVVLKPGTSEPLHGDGTYTTLQDFIEEFSESRTGKRFRKVPEKARKDSDVKADGAPKVEQVGYGIRGLSDDVLMKSLRDKRDTLL